MRPARALRDHALARPATTVLAAALAGLLLGPAGALALGPAPAAGGLGAGAPQRGALAAAADRVFDDWER